MEILDQHKNEFGIDFANNKKTLDNISIIRSKGLKNEIAGFITKLIKKEQREDEARQELERKQAEQDRKQKEEEERMAQKAAKIEEETTADQTTEASTSPETPEAETPSTEEKTE